MASIFGDITLIQKSSYNSVFIQKLFVLRAIYSINGFAKGAKKNHAKHRKSGDVIAY